MYAYLKGKVSDITEESCIVEVNNIGYNVHISSTTAHELAGLGNEVKVYTYTSVREDAIQLYGFTTQADLRMFKLLITVSGIGPKVALSILSAIDSDSIRFAVITGDVKTLSRAPGIGKKTAERMILDLKDKVDPDEYITGAPVAISSTSEISDKTANPMIKEAAEALTALGYSSSDALRAVKSVDITDGMEIEDILKLALAALY